MEHVTAVGDSLEGFTLFEFPQAYRAVHVLGVKRMSIKTNWLKKPHVGFGYVLSIGFLIVFEGCATVAQTVSTVLEENDTNEYH